MAKDTYIIKTKLADVVELVSPYGRVGTVRYGNYSYRTNMDDWNNKDAQVLGIQELTKQIVKYQSAYGIDVNTELYAQVDVYKMFSSDPDTEASVDITLMCEDPSVPDDTKSSSSEKWEKDYDTCVWL